MSDDAQKWGAVVDQAIAAGISLNRRNHRHRPSAPL
jgi:hypothetical protein